MTNSFRNGALRPAVESFFREESGASRSFLRAHLESHPGDPLAWALNGAVDFYDLVIDWIAAGGQITAGTLMRGQKLEIGGEKSRQILDSIERAEESAEAAVADSETADTGYLALCITGGVRRDYEALAMNNWRSSLAHAQRTNLMGRNLLKANARAHDAYCIFGCSEYLMARVPAAVRPFVKIPGIAGNRAKAIEYCQVCLRTGAYFREFAMCLLTALYTEECRMADAIRILSDLARAYPTNATIANELARRRSEENIH